MKSSPCSDPTLFALIYNNHKQLILRIDAGLPCSKLFNEVLLNLALINTKLANIIKANKGIFLRPITLKAKIANFKSILEESFVNRLCNNYKVGLSNKRKHIKKFLKK